MATTAEILEAARELGNLISRHEASTKLEAVAEQMDADTEAQRALNDYHRHVETLAKKEAERKPIEVEDKRRLERLQQAVANNAVLRNFQTAQMDYVDLLRQVDEAMTGRTPGNKIKSHF